MGDGCHPGRPVGGQGAFGQVEPFPSILAFVLANTVIFAATLVQAASGFGFALIAIPLLALISFEFVPGPSLFVGLFLGVLMIREGRGRIVRSEIAILVPAIALGTVFGTMLLMRLPAEAMGLFFGGLILVAILASLVSTRGGMTRRALMAGGFASGLMGTASGIPGPPLAIVYQREEIAKIRVTMALLFMFGGVLSLTGLTYAGAFSVRLAIFGLLLLPGLVMGFLGARPLRSLVTKSLARILVLSTAGIGAALLILRSLA